MDGIPSALLLLDPRGGWAAAWAVGELAVPFVVGRRVGATGTSGRRARVVTLLLGVVVVVAGVSFWDVTTVVALFALGLRSAPVAPGHLGRRLLQVALFLGCSEGLLRATVDVPLSRDQTWGPLRFAPRRSQYCDTLVGDDPDGLLASAGESVDDPRPRVLHLGDSMVVTGGAGPSERFPALVGAADPARRHVPLGLVDAGIAEEALAADRVLEGPRPAAVVLYAYPTNDLDDLDLVYPCAGVGALVDADGSYRVDRARGWWRSLPGPARAVTDATTPLWLQVAASHTFLGASLWNRIGYDGQRGLGLQQAVARGQVARVDAAWRRYVAVLGRLRADVAARAVPFAVTVLPSAEVLERPFVPVDVARAGADRILGWCRQEGVPCWDAREALVPLGRSAWGDDGIHLSVAGHRALAAWLVPRVDALLGAQGAR